MFRDLLPDRGSAALISTRHRVGAGWDWARWTALVCLMLVAATACGEPVATREPIELLATGSTSMSPLVAELAAAFEEQHPTIGLEVSGPGTGFGLEALRASDTDMALASWLAFDPPGPGDAGFGLERDWLATAIARDGIAIIVHPSNSLKGLGLLQLQDLFGGRVYEWRAVGGQASQGLVQPVSREEGSGTRAAFESLAMDGRPVTPLAIVAPSSRAVVEYVAEHPQAIGYVSMGYLSPEVKALEIEGELPTPVTAGDGSYALTRELWLVTTDPRPDAVRRFVQFALSAAGQQVVGQRYGRIK
jgi:phosphate transport system substrate-binding protein